MMERFAINILHKQIYKICRLCGVDNPVKFPIIDENETIIVGEDDEATLAKKIEECVGIQVSKDDKMPQNICSLCVDKISDFFEYRLMCAATNLQTRTILNLPLVDPTRKLLAFGGPPKDEVKDIKEDVKKVVEAASSSTSSTTSPCSGKKGRKKRPAPSPSPSPAPTTRIKAAADIVKDEPIPSTPVKALTKKERLKQLQQQKEKEEDKKKERPKQLQQQKEKEDDKKKERPKQLQQQKDKEEDKKKKDEKPVNIVVEQKHTRSKRKEPSPIRELDKVSSKAEHIVPPPKKIKFEHPCSYCSDEFKTQAELDSHLRTKHVPSVRKFGCASCRETFETVLESKDHNLWHQLTRTAYTCFKCKRKYDKNLALIKHMAMNSCGRLSRGRPPATLPDVQCRLCNKKFRTQNLYEWHSCFIKPKSKCPKCGKYFVKKHILLRHYMMFCTGTLPPPEPVIVLKEEPVDPNDKSAVTSLGASSANPERRTRRSVPVEPELPKEEREIPFPPPLELAPEVPSVPSGSKKKSSRKEVVEENSSKLSAPPSLEAEKIASLLDSGAKLDGDTDIATINNLLSSVSEAIASISEAKAKKKKKKKDKIKERVRVEEEPPEVVQKETPSPIDERSEDDRQAAALAQEVGEMSLSQQLAFCSDKLPMVVLSKTTFKEECTEIDTEPSQLQEPMDDDSVDNTVENGDAENDYDDNADNYSDFQQDEDNAEHQDQEQSQEETVQKETEQNETEQDETEQMETEQEETEQADTVQEETVPEKQTEVQDERTDSPADEDEEIPFPMPIKQESEMEEPQEENENQTPPLEEQEDSHSNSAQLSPPKTSESERLFDEQLVLTIKKEPGLETECELEPTKQVRSESRLSTISHAASLSPGRSSVQNSPKPTLILKIKKEKGLLNSSLDPPSRIQTIVLNDDTDDEDDAEKCEKESSKNKTKVYKKPNILAVKIKQEKFDPSYDRDVATHGSELPGGIQIKRERVDSDEESSQPQKKTRQETEIASYLTSSREKSCSSLQEPASSPIVAFDGVLIKQEKADIIETLPTSQSCELKEKSKVVEKRKKSKVKINPFALLKQRMAAEAAAKSDVNIGVTALLSQAPSPLPVITNVVGNAPASEASSSKCSSGKNTPVLQQSEPVVAQVSSIGEKEICEALPVPIKKEPIDEIPEQEDEEQSEPCDKPDEFPMPIKVEASDEISTDKVQEAEKPEFPMPIKEELQEEIRISDASMSSSVADSATEEKTLQKEEADSGKMVNDIIPEAKEVEQTSSERLSLETDKVTDEPENSTSPISDIPMEAYDQDSQTNSNDCSKDGDRNVSGSDYCPPSPQESQKKDKDEHDESREDSETRIEETCQAVNEIPETQIDSKASTNINANEESFVSNHTESRENNVTTQSQSSPIVDVSCTLISTEDNTIPSINDPVVLEESVPAGHVASSEPDLEELQNLLTEGLKAPDIGCSLQTLPEKSSITATDDAIVSGSEPVADDTTEVMTSRIEDELDSLLNNKLEEISDQLKQSPMTPSIAEVATTSTATSHDINLAIERELLQEIMPMSEQATELSVVSREDRLQTEVDRTADTVKDDMNTELDSENNSGRS